MVTEHCNCFVIRARIYRFLRAASTHVSPRAEREVHNVSQACDVRPVRINTSGDRRPRRTLRAEAAAYAMNLIKAVVTVLR
jgi:hypothetical protein